MEVQAGGDSVAVLQKSGELTAGPARGQAPPGTRAFPPWHRVCMSESVPAGLRRLGQAHPGPRWPVAGGRWLFEPSHGTGTQRLCLYSLPELMGQDLEP